ncbi:MAG TPA: hypothetical protein VFV33_02060, partial [Gemmatimonadaceae bacterium]|nr:hypothetical protein [Gemmatimonadaceae bacterium]
MIGAAARHRGGESRRWSLSALMAATRAAGALAALAITGCAGAAGPPPPAPPAPAPAPAPARTSPRPATPDAARDSSARLVPPGFGSLRQDDIALRVSQFGLQVRAIPLDETIIRVLSPDSYRALRDLVESQGERLRALQRRTALPRLSTWYVSFFALQQGETRFSPMEFNISNVGRDFQPLDVIPLSPGFGTQRLRQREVQHALYVFD